MNLPPFRFLLPTLLGAVLVAALAATQPPKPAAKATTSTNSFDRLKQVSRLAWFGGRPILPKGDSALSDLEAGELSDLFTEADQAYDRVPFGTEKHAIKTGLMDSLEAFLTNRVHSSYGTAIHIELGLNHQGLGHYATALTHYAAAWAAVKDSEQEPAATLAIQASNGLAELLALTGRLDELDALAAAVRAKLRREPSGAGWREALAMSRWAKRSPGEAYNCGLLCVAQLGRLTVPGQFSGDVFASTSAGPNGFSAAELVTIAAQAGLGIRAAWLPDFSVLPVPCVVHLASEHFVTVRQQQGDFYEVYDPALGSQRWLTAADVATEATGCVLVGNRAPLGAPGFQQLKAMDGAAAASFRGRFIRLVSKHFDPDNCTGSNATGGGPEASTQSEGAASGCSSCASGGRSGADLRDRLEAARDGTRPQSAGLPGWFVSEPFLNFWMEDLPLDYHPAYGPAASLKLYDTDGRTQNYGDGAYEHGARLGGDYTGYSSFWTCSWFSYAVPDSSGLLVDVLLSAGGWGTFNFATGTDVLSQVNYHNNLQLEKLGSVSSPTGFRLHYADGSYNDYSHIDTGVYYLTSVSDPTGAALTFAYSGALLSTVTTLDGVTFTLSYDATYTNLVTGVTASASSGYAAAVTFSHGETGPDSTVYDAQTLTGITDAAGIKSQIFYQTTAGAYVQTLVTPYGTTSFQYLGPTTSVFDEGMQITHPDGSGELYGSISDYGTFPGNTDWPNFSSGQIPGYSDAPVNTPDTGERQQRNSFHWTRAQFAQLTHAVDALTWDDLKLGRIRHWLNTTDLANSGTLSLEQAPSPDGTTEGAIAWLDYVGKPSGTNSINGTQIRPAISAEVRPDGTTAWTYYQRNSLGLVTQQIEKWVSSGTALYRTNTYAYDANGTDLVYHTRPDGVTDVGYAYDQANQPHLPIRMTNALGEITTYAYLTDGTHRLSTRQTPAALLSTHTYGTDKRLASVVDSISGTPLRTNSYTWRYGNLWTQTDPRALTVTYTYDYLNRLTRTDYPDSTYTQEAYGVGTAYPASTGSTNILDRTAHRDRLGNWNYTGYDALRQVSSLTNARSVVTGFGYCLCGAVTSVTNAYGSAAPEITAYTYDYQGHRTGTTYPDGSTVTQTYDALGQLTIMADALGSTTNAYDNLGRLFAATNAFGQISKTVFDVTDRGLYVTDRNGVTVTNSYDNLNRLRTRTAPDGGVEAFGYTANYGGATSYTNQVGNVTTWAFDAAQRKTSEVVVGVMTNSFTYAPASDLLTLNDGKSQTTTWAYDSYGRVLTKKYANGATNLIYTYNPLGQLTNRWSAAKGNTKYQYDAVGNQTNVDYPASTDLKFQYDALNRITNMVDAAGTTKYAYSGGLLASETNPWTNSTVSYSYNGTRQRSQMVIAQPTGTNWTSTYAYDAARRLTNVTSPAGGFTNYYKSGSPASLIGRISLPGALFITNTFDGNGRLADTTLYSSNAATALNRHGYIYNVANQRINLSRTNSANSSWAGYSTNTYDSAGELRTIRAYDGSNTSVPSLNFDYGYDAAWNMAKRTNNTTVTSYTVNNLNQVTSDGSSLGYDSNGNRTSGPGSPAAVTYEYDDENQLTAVYVAGYWKQSYTYDGRQRVRVRSDYTWINGWYPNGEVRYVYDGMEIVQERTSSNNPSVTYTRGVDLSGSLGGAGGIGGLLARSAHSSTTPYQLSTTANYHADGNGNVTALADSTGSLVANYRYDPYGRTLASSGGSASANLMRFSSKPLWAANAGSSSGGGLYYYGYRFYDPTEGRWNNRDPVMELGGINLYAYVDNDSISYIDPNGLWPWYKRYGGPNWTSGYRGTWEDVMDNGIMPLPPEDNQDRCYKIHDKCHAKCRDDFRGKCPDKWKSSKMALGGCLRDCDSDLSQCLNKLGDDPSNDWHARVGAPVFWLLGKFGHTIEPDPAPRHSHVK